jgi:hypothetical protein
MSNRRKPIFTVEDVVKMTFAINDLFDQIGNIFVQSVAPAPNSQAFSEEREFPEPELVRDVYNRGIQSIEAAADHLVAFADLLVAPAKTFAPFTCVRGLLESCALAAWFLDPEVDVRIRVGRCYAFRYEGFVQQIKHAQAKNSASEVESAKQRMKEVEKKALGLGYSRLSTKSREMSGIAQRWPGITKLIGTTLNKEIQYRLLSAVAHGHHWATYQTSYRIIEEQNSEGLSEKRLEKYVHPTLMYDLGNVAVTSLARVWWYLWKTYGWDLDELGGVLDSTYQELKYNPESQFWRL